MLHETAVVRGGIDVFDTADGMVRPETIVEPQEVSREALLMVHTRRYLNSLDVSITTTITTTTTAAALCGSIVSTLGIRTWGPRFDSRVAPLFHGVATLGKLFTHTASPVSQLQETGLQKGVFGA